MDNQKLMDHMVSFAQKYFDSENVLMPMWTLIDERGEIYVYLTPFSNGAEKDLIAELIKSKIKEDNAVRYGFMSETWMTTVSKETPRHVLENITPSEHPNRKEAILIMVEDRDGKRLNGMMEIIRDDVDHGTLNDITTSGEIDRGFRFGNMFERRLETTH